MVQKVDLQEQLKMRFLTVDYREKQEVYRTSTASADTGTIALEILNILDSVLEELLELTDPMIQLVDFLNHNKNPDNSTLAMMLTASKNVFRVVDLLREVPPFSSQDFTWLDGKLLKIFSADAVKKSLSAAQNGNRRSVHHCSVSGCPAWLWHPGLPASSDPIGRISG